MTVPPLSTDLAPFTTFRVGGPARELVTASTHEELIAAALDAWSTGDDWIVLGGGSNVVIADAGVDGTVIRVATRGIERMSAPRGRARLRVQAGEPWDALVAFTVAEGLTGLEALSGIPGSCGASPVQNIGAYGQELSDTLVAVEFLDYRSGEVEQLPASELGLGYRTSVFKRGRQGVVLSIDVELHQADDRSAGSPVEYEQLAGALGVGLGDPVPADRIRATVLELRASKGMVLDDADSDTWSAGSFFTNPIVGENFARRMPGDAPRWQAGPDTVKLSAAWLIEHAGLRRGFSLPGSRARISTKHTLAITNSGGATAAQIVELARFIEERVRNEFGVVLHPEPVYLGSDSPRAYG